ncbi:MAG: HEAT repeat domain-containing protein, partial [Candidatus Cloacimonas sp.]|nr:HEAT repeat domain-containing protein [Candidatus Cloacimonas sp.]
QLDSLSAFFYGAMIEEEDKDRYAEFSKNLPDFALDNPEIITTLLDKLNMRKMQAASLSYLAMCQVLADGAAKLKYDNKKVMAKNSVYGLMLIGTSSNDSYNDMQLKALKKAHLCLLIEPAGNDLYEMRLNTSYANYCYLLIDYAGNDIYRNTKPAEMFYSLAGLGISMDLAGDDIYQTDDFAFSAFLGTNIHLDENGNDCYRSGLFSQGAAMQGIALLVDKQGRDSYSATTLSQGLGSLGGVGAILDGSGADLYELGGKYTHAPLMPNDFRSMGQGMGFGLRSDYAGGLGLLFDKSGNDQYLGGVYAQGVGYWYATGMLIDEAGNDVYNAIYYPQGSGIHLAAGYLYDGGGNDAYYSRHGPGQGAGHDWGLGVLIDASGNDAYSIEGGNGLGLSNSVGIFVDKMGDDRYERSNPQNYGNAAFSRSTGGIGLFLDAGGKDAYPDSTKANDTNWKKGTYGIGRDIELNKPAPEIAPEQVGDDPLVSAEAPIAQVFAAAAEWEVGSAIQRVREARKVLMDRKEEGQSYILENKLNSKSGLEYRALEAFLTDNPDFKASLYDYVTDPDSLKAKMALSLISTTGDSLLILPIRQHLAEHRYITACLSLLGSIKSEESVTILSQYALHSSERYRYIVARSLRQIASHQAYALLNTMRQDNSFLVQALIRNLPEEKP